MGNTSITHGRFLLAPGVALLFTAATAAGQPRVDEGQRARAENLRKQGNDLSRDGRLSEALEAYGQAFALDQSCATAANLGNLELKLERYRDAAEHLAFALKACGGEKPALQQTLTEGLAQATPKVGTIRIHVPAEAHVAVDNRAVDVHELRVVYLDPGSHTVGAPSNGQMEPRAILVRAGEVVDLEFTTRSEASPSSTNASPSPPASNFELAPTRSATFLFGGAGVALAGAALGLGFTVAANDKYSQSRTSRNSLVLQTGPSACDPSFTQNIPACSNLRGALQDHATFSNLALWSFVGAGVAAAGTAAYVLWPKAGAKGERSATVFAPVVTERGGGMFVSGHF